MTDQELIDLVRQKPPDELSAEEVSLLRRRMSQSAAVRDALAEHVRMDQYLGAALGNVQVSVDKILSLAAAAGVRPPRPWAGWYGWGLGAIVVLIISTAALLPRFLPHEEPPDSVALVPPAAAGTDADAATSPGAGQDTKASQKNIATDDRVVPDEPEEGWVDDETSPSDQLFARRIMIEAESFQRGNVQVDAHEFGPGIGVIRSGRIRPSFIEHELDVPLAGEYELEVRFAAGEARPFTVQIGDRRLEIDGQETGGWKADHQQWSTGGAIALPAGKHLLRIEAAGELPHIDKLALTATLGSDDDQGPWSLSLRAKGPLPAFTEVCFQDFDSRSTGMTAEELKRWLLPIEWDRQQIKPRPGWSTTVEGLLRLRSPWPREATLRLSMAEYYQFQMHFWHGRRGVTLRYYDFPRPTWAAYSTTRATPKDARPQTLALVATDNDRYRRTGAGTFELRWDDGALVMTRGDVRLLTAPLVGTPGEVYFDGQASVRAISMSRSAAPPDDAVERPVALKAAQPAGMAWQRELPAGATLKKLDDGRLELLAQDNVTVATASLPLDESGLYEVILQVENPSPGTGIFLGDHRGRPLQHIGFFRDQHTGWTTIGVWQPQQGSAAESYHDIQRQAAPYVGRRPWIRLVQGAGVLKCWLSGDGIHWSQAFEPISNVAGYIPYSQIGVYALPRVESHGIRLKSLEVRELTAVSGLAPAALREAALALADDPEMDLGTWMQAVLEAQPADTDPGLWRRACAIKTLTAGPPRNLGNDLLLCLLEDNLNATAPVADRLRLIDEVALLADTSQADAARRQAQEIISHYARLGELLSASGESRAGTLVAKAAMESSLWTDIDFDPLPESLARAELLGYVNRNEWREAAETAGRIGFFSRNCDPLRPVFRGRDGLTRLAIWAEALALRQAPGEQGDLLTQSGGRHPLVEELGKEAYNILGEFKAALAGRSYDEACRIITTARTERALGLLPDARDPQLLVSLSAAVQSAFKEHPELARTMRQRFSPAGKIRVRQAAEAGDVAALEAATVQFSGTEAAADAHQWLGDHALAAGDFSRASQEYRQALPQRSGLQRAGVLARLRLTAAMNGRNEGQPVAQPVEFGGQTLPAAQFESLVAEMRQQHAAPGPAGSAAAETAGSSTLPPAQYDSRAWSAFDGPGAAEAPSGAATVPDRDAAARELATAITGTTLLVSNRLQVSAYDLASGQRAWTAAPPQQPGAAQNWLRSPMQPLTVGPRVFVRWLTVDGPTLVCLRGADGGVLWTARPGLPIVSDPVFRQNQLLALTTSLEPDRSLRVSLSTFDPDTGELLSQRFLTQVRDHWNRQLTARVVVAQERLIATFAGCVVSCDTLGGLHWLRRQVWIPPAQDASAVEQDHTPPVIQGDRLLVSQPGVRSVECLELSSGRLLWRASLPRLQTVLGPAGDVLALRTAEGICALNVQDGSLRWSVAVSDLLEAADAGELGIVYARRERLAGGRQRPRIIWLDPATGKERGSAAMDALADDQPMLGPLVRHGERTWAFYARGDNQAARQLMELTAAGEAYPAAVSATGLAGWSLRREPAWKENVGAVLPGWTLLAGANNDPSGRWLEYAGRRDVLATQPLSSRPVRLARWVVVPKDAARLRVQVGQEGGRAWRLEIRAAGRTLLDEKISPQTAAGGWKELEVDLSEYSGQGVWLTVNQHPLDDPLAPGIWKRLELAAVGP